MEVLQTSALPLGDGAVWRAARITFRVLRRRPSLSSGLRTCELGLRTRAYLARWSRTPIGRACRPAAVGLQSEKWLPVITFARRNAGGGWLASRSSQTSSPPSLAAQRRPASFGGQPPHLTASEGWSGKRDSNPRLRPWQGRTLPLSYSRPSADCRTLNVLQRMQPMQARQTWVKRRGANKMRLIRGRPIAGGRRPATTEITAVHSNAGLKPRRHRETAVHFNAGLKSRAGAHSHAGQRPPPEKRTRACDAGLKPRRHTRRNVPRQGR
jgi:hypothetical protein